MENELVERIAGMRGTLIAWTRSRGVRDPEDVAHEVIVRALQNIDKVAEAKSVTAYLLTIARHLLADRARYGLPTVSMLVDPAAHEQDAEQADPRRAMLWTILEQAASTMKTGEKALRIARLHYIEGLSTNAISEIVGMSRSGVKSALRRLRVAAKRLARDLR